MKTLKTILLTTRPPFLLLAVSVTLLGAMLALHAGAQWQPGLFALVLFGAVLAHAIVDMLNEVHDAKSGLDDITQRTAFSGGSGALQANPSAIAAVEITAFALLAILIAIGFWLINLRGWGLLPIGLLGVLVVISYTPKITRSPWLCLIAPGLGFGPLMVLGTYFVLTGEYSWLAFWVSLIPFFLVNNLLLLNQFPDFSADQQIGRKNILIAFGQEQGLRIFRWFLLAAFLTLLLLVALQNLPIWALLGGLSLIFAIPLYLKLQNLEQFNAQMHQLLGFNVIVNLTLPALIALGLLLHAYF